MPQHCYEQFDPLFSRLLDSFHNSNGDCTSEQAPQPVGFPCTSIVGSNDISLASVIPKMAFADGVRKGDSHVNNALRETLTCLSKRLVERIVLPIKCMLEESMPQ
jgi:hypothetical protein